MAAWVVITVVRRPPFIVFAYAASTGQLAQILYMIVLTLMSEILRLFWFPLFFVHVTLHQFFYLRDLFLPVKFPQTEHLFHAIGTSHGNRPTRDSAIH